MRTQTVALFLLAAAVPGVVSPEVAPPDCSGAPLLCARLMHSAYGVGFPWGGRVRLLSSLSEADFEAKRTPPNGEPPAAGEMRQPAEVH